MLIRKPGIESGSLDSFGCMLLVFSAFMLTACTSAGSVSKDTSERGEELLGYNGSLFMPSLKDLAARNEYVVGMRARVDCGGISGITGLPDGWEITSNVRGESVALSAKLEEVRMYEIDTAALKQMQSNVEKIRINILFRGQWSDCISWKIELDTVSKSDKTSAKNSYKAMELKTYRYEDCSTDHRDWCLLPDGSKK